ncbi:MAG: hypothetical protein JNJ65_01615 [Cyclobacteriaceae bacterium]|nr:hypothetical protein [Cyclobacteriaceae bacterium]
MKAFVIILLVVSVFTTASAEDSTSWVKVLSKKRSVLYFKNSKDLIGATIEIENEDHDLIESILVESKRTIVDFFYLAPGAYLVKIKKGGKEYVIEYLNK